MKWNKMAMATFAAAVWTWGLLCSFVVFIHQNVATLIIMYKLLCLDEYTFIHFIFIICMILVMYIFASMSSTVILFI